MCIAFENIRNTTEPHYLSIDSALDRIRVGQSKEKLDLIRKEKDKSKRASLKANLPSILFSANKVVKIDNSYRLDKSVSTHSGYAVFDIDDIDNAEEVRDSLKDNEYIYSAWISPSGNGVNFLVRFIKDTALHRDLYDTFISSYPDIDLDTSSRNIARVKYESYDPDIWVNESAKDWNKLPTIKEKSVSKGSSSVKVTDWARINLGLEKIRNSVDGEKHSILIKISHLFGGFSSNNEIDEVTAINLLRDEISKKEGVDDLEAAYKAIDAAFTHGKANPLSMFEEKAVLAMKIGSDKLYCSLPETKKDMDNFYENGYGTGATMSWRGSKEFIAFARGGTTTVFGLPGVGKSIFIFEVLINLAVDYGWKSALMSPEEGSAGEIFGTLVSCYMGKQFFGEYKMTDEERIEGSNFIKEHFFIIEPKTASITIDDFFTQVEGIEHQYGVKIDCTFLDPATYLKHDSNGFQREDLALNETLKKDLMSAKKNNRHHITAVHIRDMQVQKTDLDSWYFPIPTANDLAGGRSWFRAAYNMIALYRPLDTKNNPLIDDEGVPFKVNELQLWIRKTKPRGSGKLGMFKLFFDFKKNRYYELERGERIYSTRPFNIPDTNESAMKPNNDFVKQLDVVEEIENSDKAPF